MALSEHSSTDHETLRQIFQAEGLVFLGVADVPEEADPARVEADHRYHDWLAEGSHATMAYLQRHAPAKYDPSLALPGTRSVLIAGLGYHQQRPTPTEGAGLVARYAWGRDYHKVILAKLRVVAERLSERFPDQNWRSFTDTAPLDERWWAARAGASFSARNTLSIHRDLGSWFLLGEILTTATIEPTPAKSHAHGACPSGCRRCSSACPTGALDARGHLDARRCISYLTIEHRGPIDDALKPGIGAWLFGCDLCQEVCPFNLAAHATTEPEFLAWKAGPELDLSEVLVLDDRDFTARFGGSPVHRAGRDGLVRNACLVAANTNRRDLIGLLAALERDADHGVADAALWARKRLEGGSP